MALVRNGHSLSMNPGAFRCGTTAATAFAINRPKWADHGAMRGMLDGAGVRSDGGTNLARTASYPNGYEDGDAFVLAQEGGGLAAYTTISHPNTLVGAMAQGVAIASSMVSNGDLTGSLALVVALATTMISANTMSPTMLAAANLAASLAAAGDLAGAMSALANLQSAMVAPGQVTGTMLGVANMDAEMTTEGVVVSGNPAALAQAVWQYLVGSITAQQLLSNTASKTSGAVVADAGNSQNTFKTDLTEAVDDHWKDALVVFTSGALTEQIKRVLAYDGTTKFITVGPSPGFTAAPSPTDTFLLLNR